ncbi:hypothetical protein [Coleofasciculus sp. F4-SAH-05]
MAKLKFPQPKNLALPHCAALRDFLDVRRALSRAAALLMYNR